LGFLRGFGIGFAETFPQSLERVGATLGSQGFVAFESLGHGLDDGLFHALGAGFTFPKIEDLDQSADDGGVVVSVLVLETEEFTEFFEGGEHGTILSWGERGKDEGWGMKDEMGEYGTRKTRIYADRHGKFFLNTKGHKGTQRFVEWRNGLTSF
jgi:hypothetical protein